MGAAVPARRDQSYLAARVAASAQAMESRVSPEIDDWLDKKRRQPFESVIIPLDELTDPKGWLFAEDTGNLVHHTGRFFSVEGLHVRMNAHEWWQPILVQRDIAILGIIAKEFDGVLHFLMQAKMEPGNAGLVQLSPTVQATSSCYTRVHGGNSTPYVEYFIEATQDQMLVDSLQSEQGFWFHLKRNRNMVVEITDPVPVQDDFCWLTLGQIRRLLQERNAVNMDARSVLGCLPAEPPVADPSGVNTLTEVISWFTTRKSVTELDAKLVPLDSVRGWNRDSQRVSRVDGRNFDIVGVQVSAHTREVTSWRQPLLAPVGLGLAGLVVRHIDGKLHALVRAEVQPGYRDGVELGPTVRYAMVDYEHTPANDRPEFLDYLLSAHSRVPGIRYDVVQSEEGGRFLYAENRYLVVEDDDFPLAVPPDFAWVTIDQLMALQRHSYYLGVEARTLLLCLNSL
jgi:oxidase EvaA